MAVSETIVRECLEHHGLLVRQCRKHVAPGAREEADIDFLVLNPCPEPASGPLPFVLAPADLRRLERAVVVVRGWHTETFSPARLTGTPEFFRFVEPERLRQALRAFGPGPSPAKILVLPGLPHTPALRRQSIALLRERGVDAVLPFRALLADLIEHVEPNRNYQKSDLLQTLRLLKHYEFLRDDQLDLFKPPRRRRVREDPTDRADHPPASRPGA
jgi:hypothetical protein